MSVIRVQIACSLTKGKSGASSVKLFITIRYRRVAAAGIFLIILSR